MRLTFALANLDNISVSARKQHMRNGLCSAITAALQALHKKAVAGTFVRDTSDSPLALVRWEQLFRRLDFDQNKHLDLEEFKRSLRGTLQISRREVR